MTDTHISFVRHEEIPPSPPPVAERGVLKWMRENLFSNWFSAILTLVALYIIAKFLIGVFPWFYNGVWDAGSIRECRDILEGRFGACFAVLVDRWDHLLFGFKYPQSEYWRPVLGFVLLVLAAMPALFYMYIPTKFLIGTALYPFLAYWLLWGGTLWLPIAVLAAIIATAFVFRFVEAMSVQMRTILAGLVGVAGAIGLAYLLYLGAQELWFISDSVGSAGGFAAIAGYLFKAASIFTYIFAIPMGIFVGYAIFQSAEDGGLVTVATALLAIYLMLAYAIGPVSEFLNGLIPIELQAVPSRDMGGYMLCMMLGTVCVSLSVPLGIVLALGRQSKMPLIKGVCVVFIEFVRGVPLITLLFVANVMLAYFFPPGSGLDLCLSLRRRVLFHRVLRHFAIFAVAGTPACDRSQIRRGGFNHG